MGTLSESTVRAQIMSTSLYADGHAVTELLDMDLPAPPGREDDMDQWAEDALYPITGTGDPTRENMDACYTIQVVDCEDRPDLNARTWEWGL